MLASHMNSQGHSCGIHLVTLIAVQGIPLSMMQLDMYPQCSSTREYPVTFITLDASGVNPHMHPHHLSRDLMLMCCTKVCKRYLLERAIDSYPDLLGVLSVAFDIQPDDLHVYDMLASTDREVQTAVESWLMSYGIMRKQYLHFIVNRRKPIDGLFLWLSVHTMRQHVNILHTSGIWTLRCSDITALTDASVVLILNYCLVTKRMTREKIQKRDDVYTKQLCDP